MMLRMHPPRGLPPRRAVVICHTPARDCVKPVPAASYILTHLPYLLQ